MRHIYVAFFILVHIGTSSAQTPAGLCPSFDGTDSSFTKCFGRDVQFAGIRNPGAIVRATSIGHVRRYIHQNSDDERTRTRHRHSFYHPDKMQIEDENSG